MGAWIEILLPTNIAPTGDVAPLVGAWIEIEYSSISEATREKSLLSWERGLKYASEHPAQRPGVVAPLVGAWIEILS